MRSQNLAPRQILYSPLTNRNKSAICYDRRVPAQGGARSHVYGTWMGGSMELGEGSLSQYLCNARREVRMSDICYEQITSSATSILQYLDSLPIYPSKKNQHSGFSWNCVTAGMLGFIPRRSLILRWMGCTRFQLNN